MKHVKISGQNVSEMQTRAAELYLDHAGEGLHTVLIGITEHRNSLTERRMSKCDVLITVHREDGPLTIETTK